MDDAPNILQMIAQLHQLQRQLAPIIPQVSRKLVNDLLSTGVTPKQLGKAIGRSPTYVKALGNGAKSLNAGGIVRVLQFAAAKQQEQANVPAE
jgi:hypothetical protein